MTDIEYKALTTLTDIELKALTMTKGKVCCSKGKTCSRALYSFYYPYYCKNYVEHDTKKKCIRYWIKSGNEELFD